MKTGILASLQNLKNLNKSNNKIPHYARDYKKEYLFIRGLNKEFKYFVNNMDNISTRELFQNHKADRIKYFIKRFLKAQKTGKLKDTKRLFFWKYDILNLIEFYENITFDILEIKYADHFYDLFCKFYSKINYKYYDYDGNVKVKECDNNEYVIDESDSLLYNDL